MEDLFVNFIGATVFSVIGYFYLKHRGEGKFAKAFIPTIEETNKEPDSGGNLLSGFLRLCTRRLSDAAGDAP